MASSIPMTTIARMTPTTSMINATLLLEPKAMGIGPMSTTPPYSVLDLGSPLLIASDAAPVRSSDLSMSVAIKTNPTMKLEMMSSIPRRKTRLEPENTGKTMNSDTSASPVATAVATNANPAANIAMGIQRLVRTGSTMLGITVKEPYVAF